jgi:hypothetical protein
MLKATVNLRLMNEGIKILSKEGDPDVRRIPTRMNMAGMKIRKAKWTSRILPGSQLALKTEGGGRRVLASMRPSRGH